MAIVCGWEAQVLGSLVTGQVANLPSQHCLLPFLLVKICMANVYAFNGRTFFLVPIWNVRFSLFPVVVLGILSVGLKCPFTETR